MRARHPQQHLRGASALGPLLHPAHVRVQRSRHVQPLAHHRHRRQPRVPVNDGSAAPTRTGRQRCRSLRRCPPGRCFLDWSNRGLQQPGLSHHYRHSPLSTAAADPATRGSRSDPLPYRCRLTCLPGPVNRVRVQQLRQLPASPPTTRRGHLAHCPRAPSHRRFVRFVGRRSSRRMVAGLRAAARRAAAMLTAPASRSAVVTRLRMQARTAGALPVRARWASSR
jgi:hypothetical protein